MMRFHTYGPFRIRVQPNGLIGKNPEGFWQTVETSNLRLPEAKGCYVFGIRGSGGKTIRPWYVGRTNKLGFGRECFTTHKLNHYNNALADYKKGTPFLFLIPRLNRSGNIYGGTTSSSIKFLENYLIGLAITSNQDLRNTYSTKAFRQVQLPGFLNSPQGMPTTATSALKRSLKAR